MHSQIFPSFFILYSIAYGIAAQSLMFPELPFSAQTVVSVFYRPYFQIYGELMLDEVNEETGCVGVLPFLDCAQEVCMDERYYCIFFFD